MAGAAPSGGMEFGATPLMTPRRALRWVHARRGARLTRVTSVRPTRVRCVMVGLAARLSFGLRTVVARRSGIRSAARARRQSHMHTAPRRTLAERMSGNPARLSATGRHTAAAAADAVAPPTLQTSHEDTPQHAGLRRAERWREEHTNEHHKTRERGEFEGRVCARG